MLLNAVPYRIGAGLFHRIHGLAGITCRVTDALAGLKSLVLRGVKRTDKVSVPTPSTVPSRGVYAKVPATQIPWYVALASSWFLLNGVP
jgi:hypothetical protein